MPEIFHRVGSLDLISQECMEQTQQAIGTALRLSNHFCNGGAVPKEVTDKGDPAAIEEYLLERATNKNNPGELRNHAMHLCMAHHRHARACIRGVQCMHACS
jgi:hypothetical protein